MSIYNNTNFTMIDRNEAISTPATVQDGRRTTWIVFAHKTVLISVCILAVSGLAGNCLVIADLFKKNRKRECRRENRTGNALLLHKVFTDILVIITTGVACVYMEYDVKKACTPTFASSVAIRYISVYTLSLLSYERYRNFVCPFNTNVTTRKVFIWLALVWILSFGFSIPLFLPSLHLGSHDCVFAPEMVIDRQIYYVWLFLSQYLAPVLIIACVNTSTIRYVKRTALLESRQRKGNSKSSTKQECTVFNCKVFRILLYMLGVFAVCMLPQHIVNFILEFTDKNTFSSQSLNIAAEASYFVMVLLNAVLDPFLYGAINRKYHFKMPLWLLCQKGPSGGAGSKREIPITLSKSSSTKAETTTAMRGMKLQEDVQRDSEH